MEMHQIRYFLAVAEELNFTRAAERCNVSQPSLTRAIKMLEEELGGQLFRRERSKTHLSELGRMVVPHLRQISMEASEAKQRARALRSLHHAVLKLGLMCTIGPSNLLELVRGIRMRHPGIELQITDATAAELYERLDAGDLEVAVYCHPDHDSPDKLNCVPLFRERFVIVISPEHPLAEQETIRVRDLDGQHYLQRVHCEYAEHAGRIFQERGVSDHTVYRSDRDDWILAMAAAGMGYAFMPEQCACHPQVAVRPLVEPEIWREVSLVTVRGRPHTPAVGALVREAMRSRRLGHFPGNPPSIFDPAKSRGQSAA